jgi:peptidoglycan/LPS O-acetylase OafA/YrhL
MQQCPAFRDRAKPAYAPFTFVNPVANSRTTPTPPARNDGIDLLRGLSIVLVVMHHVGLRMPLKQGVLADIFPKWLLNALAYNGYEAVIIFFVISGFLITHNTLARWGSLGAMDWRAFYARRAARILPCLLLLLALLSVLHVAGVKGYAITREGQSLPAALAAALGLYLNWYEGQTGYLPANWDVLWSLSVEEVFYLAFPLLCLTLRRERALLPLLLALALLLPYWRASVGGTEVWQEKAYLPGFSAIAMGVLGALLAARAGPRRAPFNTLLAAGGAVGLTAVLAFQQVLWSLLGFGCLLLLTFSTLCLLLAFHWQAHGQAQPWRFHGTRWLRACGRLSYEIYLTHMFVVLPLVQIARASGAPKAWGFVWYPPAVALSWLLGWLVARTLSDPCERWVRRRLSPATAGRPASMQSA